MKVVSLSFTVIKNESKKRDQVSERGLFGNVGRNATTVAYKTWQGSAHRLPCYTEGGG